MGRFVNRYLFLIEISTADRRIAEEMAPDPTSWGFNLRRTFTKNFNL